MQSLNRKQTEFVSAYAHLKNPNEDMAESLSYFIVNPDALKSRSLSKYEFVRDRIMQGNIYISQIQEKIINYWILDTNISTDSYWWRRNPCDNLETSLFETKEWIKWFHKINAF